MLEIWLGVHVVAVIVLIGIVVWRRREDRLHSAASRVKQSDGETLDVNAFLDLLRPQ